jgi:hypothetical protein
VEAPSPSDHMGGWPPAEEANEPLGSSYADGWDRGGIDGWAAPRWTVSAQALFWQRSAPRSQTLLVNEAGQQLLNADALHFGMQPGWEIGVSRRLNTGWSLEGRYLSVGSGKATVGSLVGDGGAGVFYHENYPESLGIFRPNVDNAITYRSEFQSVTVGLRRQATSWLDWTAGFRYVKLEEDGLAVVQRDLANLDVDVAQRISVQNDLYGFQLGAELLLWRRGRLRLDSSLQAGIYQDRARNRLAYESAYFGESSHTGTAREHTAFVGEWGVTGTYDITRRLALRTGYRMLWLDGVAVASEQPSVNPGPPVAVPGGTSGGPAETVHTGGDVFYHGAFVGLEFRH